VVEYPDRRNPTMNRAATPAPPLAVDVPVTLTAIVRPEEAGGYSASIPALPGCHTQGETLDEVRANLREAAAGWLAVAHEDGLAREAAGGAA
jgi:predicted RNase H-like HicB family nuclease